MLGVRLFAVGSVLGLAWTTVAGDGVHETSLIGGSAMPPMNADRVGIVVAQADGRPRAAQVSLEPTAITAPSISRVDVSAGGSVRFAGLASPGARVLIRSGAAALGTARVDEAGNWLLDVAGPLRPGEHHFAAEASNGGASIPGDELRIAIPESFDGALVAFERPAEDVARERSQIARERRQQAERLAEAASRKFTELTGDPATGSKAGTSGSVAPKQHPEQIGARESVGTVGDRPSDPAGRSGVGDTRVTVDNALLWVQEWLAKANRDYQREIVRRLQIPAPAPEEFADSTPAPPDPAPSPARVTPGPAHSEHAGSSAPGATSDPSAADAARVAEERAARQREHEERESAEKAAAEKADAERRRREREEEEQKAARLLAERLEAENEARRIAAEKADAERSAKQQTERAMAAQRQAEEQEAERQRAVREETEAAARRAAEKAAAAKAEAARVAEEAARKAAALKAEAERAATGKAAAEKAAAARSATAAVTPDKEVESDRGRPVEAARVPSRAVEAPRASPRAAAPADVSRDAGSIPAMERPDRVPPRQTALLDRDDGTEERAAVSSPRRQRASRVAGWRSVHAACPAAGRRVSPPATYTVARGDTLWAIAYRHYRLGRLYPLIEEANPDAVEDPHTIQPCQRLFLPKLKRTASRNDP